MGQEEVFENFKLKNKDKEIRYTEGLGKILKDEEGEPIEFLVAFNDITQRIQSQKELASAQDKYEMLFKNMNDAIVAYDYADERIIDYNDSALSLLKHSPESLKSKTRWDIVAKTSKLFPDLNLHERIKDQEGKITKGQAVKTRGVLMDSENNELLTDVSIIPSHIDKNQAYLVIRDITEQYKAHLEIQEKSAIYKSILTNSFDGIDVIEYREEAGQLKDGKLIVRNNIMEEILQDPNTLYDNLEELMSVAPEYQPNGVSSREEVREKIKEFLDQKVSFSEFMIDKPDGTEIHLETSHLMVTIKDKVYVVRNFKDITQRKKANDIIRRQIEDLNNKNRQLQKYIDSNLQLENFAYIASHDLKAPIRSVISFMQLLRKNVKDDIAPKNLKFVDIVLEASTNMQVLIDDLLAFSRINTKDVEIERLDLKKLLRGLLNELNSNIEEKKASINFQNIPDYINADFMRIKQVFQNLISNGMKFMEEGVKPVIDVSYIDQDEYHKFSVQDNGIGIEPDYLDQIFLMFKKLHSENKYQGTGIGLSICKKVIDQHHGNIWVESVLGKGSVFHFTLRKDLKPLDS